MKELETERFLLQHILPADQVFIFEGLSHPLVIPYYGISYKTFEATAEQMQFYKELEDTNTGKWWKIVNKQTGAKTGAIGFNNYQQQHKKAEIGFWLLPQFWKKGIISEVFPAVIKYMQIDLGIHRIEGLVEDGNSNSAAVLEKNGFKLEGKMRDCEIKNDRFISLLIYSLLSNDHA